MNIKIAQVFGLMVLLFTSMSENAQAQLPVDLSCNTHGGGIAIQLPTSSQAGHVWQTDGNDQDGLALELSSFVVASDGSLNFEGLLEGELKVRGSVRDHQLKYELYDTDTASWILILDQIKCTP